MQSKLFEWLNEQKKHYPKQTYFLLLEIKYIQHKGVMPGEGYFSPLYNILSEYKKYTLIHNEEELNKEDLFRKKPLDIKPPTNRKPIDRMFGEFFEHQFSAKDIDIVLPDKPKKKKTYKNLDRKFKQGANGIKEEISNLDKVREEAEERGLKLIEKTYLEKKTSKYYIKAYGFDKEECYQWEMDLEQPLITICREWNDEQLKILYERKSYLETENETIPNKRTKKQIKITNGFIKNFKDWYTHNNQASPDENLLSEDSEKLSGENAETETYTQEDLEEPTFQRDAIFSYLIKNGYSDKNSLLYVKNMKGLARKITSNLYPELKNIGRERKIDSIRQELIQIKNGSLPYPS